MKIYRNPSDYAATLRPSTHAKDEAGRFNLLGHDLRAAVSDVLGGLRMINPQGLDAAAKLQFERVRTAGEGLARLLEEGMSFLPDEGAAGPVAVRTGTLLHDLEMRWAGRARQKGLSLQISVSSDAPRHVLVDRTALDRALSNVLSNAINCTTLGEIRLTVSTNGPERLKFCIVDQGPGFPRETLDQLWEIKQRNAATPHDGQGLGLHICKQMADRLGATICVRNLDLGAEVEIDVPVDALAEGVTTALPDLRGKRALIAEDSETNQAILSQMLLQMGAQVSVAEDGVAALDLIAQAEGDGFDLALIDIEMPRLNGIEVIRALRGTGSAQIPIVAVTAYVLRSNREAIYAAGADAILAKPLENIYITGAALIKAQQRRDQTLPLAARDLPQIDRLRFDHLLEMAGAEASEFLRRLIADLTRCERGLVAGLARADLVQIHANAHILLAVAGAVGALKLQALASALTEQANRATPADIEVLGQETLCQIDLLIQDAVRASPLPAPRPALNTIPQNTIFLDDSPRDANSHEDHPETAPEKDAQ